jgi:hypothetical protein
MPSARIRNCRAGSTSAGTLPGSLRPKYILVAEFLKGSSARYSRYSRRTLSLGISVGKHTACASSHRGAYKIYRYKYP